MSSTLFAAPTTQALAREHPEWRAWLALLDVTAEEASGRAWENAVPAEAGDRAPLLAGASPAIERAVAERWVRRLFEAAEGADLRPAAARCDALAVIEAAINGDGARLDDLARAAGAPTEAFGAVAPLAAMPWLQACARRLAPPARGDGVGCPVCGAWPALAEARGLERERRLRCTRCGGDWPTAWLACVFCGNDDHTRLASLVPEGTGESRRVEACRACLTYVKTLTTLTAADATALRLLDLATVELDLAALARGFSRPEGLARSLDVRLAERPAARRFWRR